MFNRSAFNRLPFNRIRILIPSIPVAILIAQIHPNGSLSIAGKVIAGAQNFSFTPAGDIQVRQVVEGQPLALLPDGTLYVPSLTEYAELHSR